MKLSPQKKLREVALLFFKLGCIGFGGPAAHIALMEREVVFKRAWMSQQQFLDLIGATNLIPGPNSTEMTMHCGYLRAGKKGLFVAGVCFIIPAVIITSVIAWLYMRYGTLPEIQPYVFGIKPIIISIILGAVYSLAKKAIKTYLLLIFGVLTIVICAIGLNEIVALFAVGFLGVLISKFKKHGSNPLLFIWLTPKSLVSTISTTKVLSSLTLGKLFLIFLKVGALLYGSGYVLFAFLEEELVQPGFISMQQLIDSIAVGQFTPGPVFSAATFIGWQIHGFWGASLATIGIFLPSFVFVLLVHPYIHKLRNSKTFSAFLDSVNVASIAIIILVLYNMGRVTFLDWKSVMLGVCGLLVTLKFPKINSAFLVFGGAVLGYFLHFI